MKPTDKSTAITNLLESVSGRTTAITSNRCLKRPIGCGNHCGEFRDKLSEKEYQISGLCQNCQDEVFGVSDDELT